MTSPERAALEGVHAATETIREALAARDPLTGLVWMFGTAEVCARFDVLNQALDVLDSAQSALNVRGDTLEQRAADAVRLLAVGDHPAGTIALIGLVGERPGRALAAVLRRELRRGGGSNNVHPPVLFPVFSTSQFTDLVSYAHDVFSHWERMRRRGTGHDDGKPRGAEDGKQYTPC